MKYCFPPWQPTLLWRCHTIACVCGLCFFFWCCQCIVVPIVLGFNWKCPYSWLACQLCAGKCTALIHCIMCRNIRTFVHTHVHACVPVRVCVGSFFFHFVNIAKPLKVPGRLCPCNERLFNGKDFLWFTNGNKLTSHVIYAVFCHCIAS
jgi:hypothetical protein